MPKKLSIIIPIYNVEKYLVDCLDSVLPQLDDRVEVICVEDCSSDGSKDILLEYEKTHDIVVVLHTKNQGLSAARNTGMKAAVGDYIYFLDSDDMLGENAIARMLEELDKNPTDIITFDTTMIYEEGVEPNKNFTGRRSHKYEDKCKGVDMYLMLNENKDYVCTVWQHLFKRTLLEENEIRFQVGRIHEDYLFCFLNYMNAKSVRVLPEQLHYYRIRKESISTSAKYDSSRQLDIIDTYHEVYRFGLESSDEDIKKATTIQLESLKNKVLLLNDLGEISEISKYNPLDRFAFEMILNDRRHKPFWYVRLKEKAKGYKTVYLYGAGKVAKKVLSVLLLESFDIEGIIVSQIDEPLKRLMGFEPNEYQSISEKLDENCLIIIGVSRKATDEVIYNIRRQNQSVGIFELDE